MENAKGWCGDKMKYTREQANRAMAIRTRAKGGSMKRYICLVCGCYHVSHSTSRKPSELRKRKPKKPMGDVIGRRVEDDDSFDG